MDEAPIGKGWYRDGYLFEPLVNGRVRINFVDSNNKPEPLVLNKDSWASLCESLNDPKPIWSSRGRNKKDSSSSNS